MELQLIISYSQLCVFDASLDAPYNDWTERHVAQGFSWRPGSVSFAVGDDPTSVVVDVSLAERAPDLSLAEAAIRVPFTAPPSGAVEIGSIASGEEVPVPPGAYALYFLSAPTAADPIRLVFVPAEDVEPAVLKDGRHAKAQDRYAMAASPA